MAWYDYIPAGLGGHLGDAIYGRVSGKGSQLPTTNAIGDWGNTKPDAAKLPYAQVDRDRLQHLMTYGTEPGAGRGLAPSSTMPRSGGGGAVGSMVANTYAPQGGGAGAGATYGPYATASQVGADPYGGRTDANLSRLNDQAQGRGPSLADQQYNAAHQQNINAQRALAAGGRGAQGSRFASQQIARTGAGLTAGVTEARTREQMGAQSAYNQALQGAQGSQLQRDSLNAQLEQQAALGNQRAYLDLLAKQLGLSTAHLQAAMGNSQLPNNSDQLMQLMGTILPFMG